MQITPNYAKFWSCLNKHINKRRKGASFFGVWGRHGRQGVGHYEIWGSHLDPILGLSGSLLISSWLRQNWPFPPTIELQIRSAPVFIRAKLEKFNPSTPFKTLPLIMENKLGMAMFFFLLWRHRCATLWQILRVQQIKFGIWMSFQIDCCESKSQLNSRWSNLKLDGGIWLRCAAGNKVLNNLVCTRIKFNETSFYGTVISRFVGLCNLSVCACDKQIEIG